VTICILLPSRGPVDIMFTHCLAQMIVHANKSGIKIENVVTARGLWPDDARNNLAKSALASESSHFLWVDDDMFFNHESIEALWKHNDLDMVGAVAFGRLVPIPYIYLNDGGNLCHVLAFPDDLFEVDAIGFGMVLMRRQVLEKVEPPWFSFWHEARRGGEDVHFCERAKAAGVRIWCEGRLKIGHLSYPRVITEDDYRIYMKERGVPADHD